ncbi:flagellar biosynthesis protein FlhB [Mangrovibrevibacter kandeliae]|uniref:flagellar biosynthesis protein FlhB n=1 Tax=Mangrovibrevibacter kandeliae TaxID=2968473 RepID=UPI002117D3A8|nr:flagellar biosynthesis protein FlhB [Aurantimonas sp. MSK8Z-1]MCQ8780912.1 flagellar biosynthesis protein FlhB [Aurantimonas sp. CSK15Z-1]MCW4113693.1 flagellar biosynthesis protein FlhB [Aurantimonas sp. MSK8Z-1]
MSEASDRDSKTEQPTEKKIRDTIEKGNLPFSREAPILASLLATMAFIAFQARQGAGRLFVTLETTYENPTQWDLKNGADALHLISMLGLECGRFLLPAAALFIFGGVVSSLIQNPPQINLERIRPKLSNISITSGWSRTFGVRGLTEFGKALFKFLTIGGVVGLLLASQYEALVKAMFSDPLLLPETILSLSMQLLSGVSIATILLVAADLLLSRLHWRRDLKMTKQEIKEEMKQAEGDPMVKARQRQIARERTRKRMMAAVPGATLVIANPTHYAIALRYHREEGGAPVVVAKGTDLIALKIREIAEENGVPVIEDKLLARSMYDHVQIDQMIPPQFFKAVAEIIYYLYSQSGTKVGAAAV